MIKEGSKTMKNTFDTNDFETLLKQNVEEFTMYPSKRIWHSIYNNIHPSKRWPSFAMSLLLVVILFLVGYLNTNSRLNKDVQLSQSLPTNFGNKTIATNNPKTFDDFTIITNTASTNPFTGINIDNSTESVPEKNKLVNNQNHSINSKSNIQKKNSKDYHSLFSSLHKKIINTEGLTHLTRNNLEKVRLNNLEYKNNNLIKSQGNISATISTVQENTNSQTKLADKAFIENYALYNKPVTNEYNNKLALQLYVTPSMVYRKLVNKLGVNNYPEQLASRNNTIAFGGELNQKPSIGFEAGAGLQYLLNNSISFKTGFQFNYTRYNSLAFENPHTISTSLSMIDAATGNNYDVFKSTPYTNAIGTDPVKLHNETYQLSIPVGADITVAGKNKLQWHVGATIQPTYIINGNAYLPSTNGNAYVKDITYLNRWNLNAGVETFISYKVKDITWQVGPQYRMQLFTTNNKSYFMNEKLTNYGVKIGISKTLR